jgi:hypothetical protein
MKITFYYSKDAQKNYFVQNGQQLAEQGELEYDPTTLTTEQRELIYDKTILYGYKISFGYPCTIKDILAYLDRVQREEDLKFAEAIAAALAVVDEWHSKTAMEIATNNIRQINRYSHEVCSGDYRRAETLLNPNLTHSLVGDAIPQKMAAINQAIAAAKELLKDRGAQDRVRDEQAEELREANVEAEKQRKLAEIAEWIDLHGDEQLKLAHANNYKCHRLYVTQRAALEHPGFIVDFSDKFTWKERVGPSLTALKKLGEYPGTNATIVWLTGMGDDDEEIFEFECSEAITIRNYLGKYDLILPIEVVPVAAD